jgi:minor extracellular serine protease Vpr
MFAGPVTLSDAGLRALAQTSGGELTFTCTPPGSGARIAAEPMIGPTPAATTAGLVSAANPAPGSAVAPGSMASLYGTNLSSAKLLAGAPLPFLLGGTSMTVANSPAPLFYVSQLQVNFQVPWISIAKPTQFPLRITQGESFTTIEVTLTPYAPALFTTNGQGSGQASAIISNTTSLAAPSGAFPGSRPAKKGEFVLLYCTGLGDVKNHPAAGAVSPSNPPATTVTTPTLMVGGASVPVSFSGLAPGFVGLYQVNFQIPNSAPSGDAVPVVLSMGGINSNSVTIAIQ